MISFQVRCFQNSPERADWDILARVPRYCHNQRLVGMLELAVAALGGTQDPPTGLQFADDVPNLHDVMITRPQKEPPKSRLRPECGTTSGGEFCLDGGERQSNTRPHLMLDAT